MKIAGVFAVVYLLWAGVGARAEDWSRLTETDARQLVQDAVDKEKRAPGIVVVLIDTNGSHVITYGSTKSWQGENVDGDTLFEIGSITKVFTTLLLQDMVDRGEVKLDDPIGKFLPASVRTPSRNGKEITLYDLATHTSGLPRLPFNAWYMLGHFYDPYVDFRVKDFYKFLSSYTLTNDIGTHFEYSNAGMSLLGHLLSLQAGTNYEALVRERICQPLGMDSTCVVMSREQRKHAADGHDSSGDFIDSWTPSDFPGAGELRSSAKDMLKFMTASMGLTPSSLSNAMSKTQIPQRETDSRSEKVALGWFLKSRSGILWHDGGTQGFRAYVALNQAEHRGVLVLANSENDLNELGEILMGLRKWRKTVPMDPKSYDRFKGTYQFDAKRVLTVSRRYGHLYLQVTGQRKFEAFPESEKEFFTRDINGQAKFITNEVGKTVAMIWYQNGSKGTELKRLK